MKICDLPPPRPTLAAAVLLTRIWAVVLAVLATGCLAGMFLVSADSGGGFTESDRNAIRVVTEAGLVALEAEIQASPVQQVNDLLRDADLREGLERSKQEEEDLPDEEISLRELVGQAVEGLRQRTGTDGKMTLAVIEKSGLVLAVNGEADPYISEVIANDAFRNLRIDEAGLFSITLGDELHAAQATAPGPKGRRLVAVSPLDLGAGSLVRRVLGAGTPAGIVLGGKLIGKLSGDSDELEAVAISRHDDAPSQGASKVFGTGEGLNARLGALGRVPTGAGKGRTGALLVVLSDRTVAASTRGLAESLSQAREKGLLARVNWVLLIGLLLVSGGLAVYLPQLEAVAPMQRLTREFEALGQGAQHQIFHDRYSGVPGRLAQSAAASYEALRQAFLSELEIDDEPEADEVSTSSRSPRPRTIRARRLTRAHKNLEDAARRGPEPVPTRRRSRVQTPEPELEPEPQAEPEPSPVFEPAPPAEPAPRVLEVARAPTPPDADEIAETARAQRPSPQVAAPPPRAPGLAPAPEPPLDLGEDDENAAYRDVFEEFFQVKAACGEPTESLTFDRFAAKLRKNEHNLMKKRPGIKGVQFTVYVKDGKAALKAKVVK